MLHAVVAGYGAPLVGLKEIFHRDGLRIFFDDIAAGDTGAVLHHYHLEIAAGLGGEAREEILHLVGAIVYGDYD